MSLNAISPSEIAPDIDRDATAVIRVVSIPAGHPYVRSVTSASSVSVLPDPVPDGAPEGQWWPPVALDAEWIRAHSADADILHIHFGTESLTHDELVASLNAAHAAGWPIVFTVHDLVHPQLTDQRDYERQLDVLVPAADALLTLTHGAAAEIKRRWARPARVVAHPSLLSESLVESSLFAPADDADEVPDDSAVPFRIGMHLKDLRSNVDATAMVEALGAGLEVVVAAGIDAVAEVHLHHTVRDDVARDRVRALCAASDRITLVEHGRFTDDELIAELARLDVCVLPYGYGTHSGWLELCWDLAVPVVVPAVGFYAEQHIDDSVASFTAEPSGESLAHAVLTIAESPGATRAASAERELEMGRRREERFAQDDAVAAEHALIYRALLSERRS